MRVGNGLFFMEKPCRQGIFLWKGCSLASIFDEKGVILLPGWLAFCQKSGIFWAGTNYHTSRMYFKNRTVSTPFAGEPVIKYRGMRLSDDQDIVPAGDLEPNHAP